MSRYVYLHCTDHKDSSDGQNKGEEKIRAMWATRAHVKALADSGAWSTPTPENGDYVNLFAWIAEHHDCAVILRDEYGGIAAVDDTARCSKDCDEQDVATWTGRRERSLEECGIYR